MTTNTKQLSAQLAIFGAIDTMTAQSLWAIALQTLPPEQLRAMCIALPIKGAIAWACRDGLLALALERHAPPMGLGDK